MYVSRILRKSLTNFKPYDRERYNKTGHWKFANWFSVGMSVAFVGLTFLIGAWYLPAPSTFVRQREREIEWYHKNLQKHAEIRADVYDERDKKVKHETFSDTFAASA